MVRWSAAIPPTTNHVSDTNKIWIYPRRLNEFVEMREGDRLEPAAIEVCRKLSLLRLCDSLRCCHPINNVHQGIVVPILQPKNVCHGLAHGGIQREQLCFGEAATGGVLQIVLLLVLIEPPSDIELSGRHSFLSLCPRNGCLAQVIVLGKISLKAGGELLEALFCLDRRSSLFLEEVEESHDHLTPEVTGAKTA